MEFHKNTFDGQLRDVDEVRKYCLKKRELENTSASEGSKQVLTFLKPRVGSFRTNGGDTTGDREKKNSKNRICK